MWLLGYRSGVSMHISASLRRRAALAGAAALAVLTLTPAAASAQSPSGDAGVKTYASHADVDKVRDFWTENRLADAGGEDIDHTTLSPPGELLTPDADRLGYAPAAQPYVNHGSRGVGKIAMLDGTDPSNCSAAAIGGDLILTAAHCLVDPGDPSQLTTKLAFVPDYGMRGDYHPFGVWPVVATYIPSAYVTKAGDGNYPYDVAVMRVADDQQGASLEDVIGTSYDVVQSTHGAPAMAAVYGYPGMGGPKYNGGPQMFYCVARLEDDGQAPVSEMRTENCAVQGGNSGGPLFDHEWRIVGVTQSGTALDEDGNPVSEGEKGAYEDAVFARLHPDTYGRVIEVARADAQD